MTIPNSPTNEVWRDVVGYEGIYQVSDHGRVRRVNSVQGKKAGRIFTGVLSHKGYPFVLLTIGSKPKSISVHSLVARAFIGERPKGYEINHKNGVKTDNRVENLEYLTPRDNQLHAIRTGLKQVRYGEDHGGSKLTWEKVNRIRAMYATGNYKQVELAEIFETRQANISEIVRGNTWKHTPAITTTESANS